MPTIDLNSGMTSIKAATETSPKHKTSALSTPRDKNQFANIKPALRMESARKCKQTECLENAFAFVVIRVNRRWHVYARNSTGKRRIHRPESAAFQIDGQMKTGDYKCTYDRLQRIRNLQSMDAANRLLESDTYMNCSPLLKNQEI
ncbi:hypothetical protein GH714_006974 [Hevea brasiliensis]|uniref:Uncharacterized protein n=1 Tax=Hevea brasiliensis TaxID=3981 RepID=A0A6A6MX57_HEVBR|nr:hypothetical protein GH714_006974 [Hevea brasiliensis]